MGLPRRGDRLTEQPSLRPAEFGFPRTDLRRRLVAAILRGEKTATSGLLSDFEADGERLPEVEERFAVIDEQDREVGIVETTEVRVTTISQVDLAFAHDEGEGFASVANWRAAHERFWLSYAPPGWEPSDETPIVCERFRLVKPADPADR